MQKGSTMTILRPALFVVCVVALIFLAWENYGWRLQVDLFEAREMDVLLVAALANRSMVVDMEIGPHETKADHAQAPGEDG